MIDYLGQLQHDSDAVLAAVRGAALTEPIPSCPGWTMRDLVVHLGAVHRWATAIVRTGAAQPQDEPVVTDVPAWFGAGAQELRETLATARPEAPCWSFTTDRTAGFWLRRQALETLVHRWDAQQATGRTTPIDPDLAADGVSEVVDLLVPRQLQLGRLTPLPGALELRAVDTETTWTCGEGRPVGTVEAPAATLLLLLWHRLPADDASVRVDGAARSLLGGAFTP